MTAHPGTLANRVVLQMDKAKPSHKGWAGEIEAWGRGIERMFAACREAMHKKSILREMKRIEYHVALLMEKIPGR